MLKKRFFKTLLRKFIIAMTIINGKNKEILKIIFFESDEIFILKLKINKFGSIINAK